jgi:hypothetical protein
MQPDSTSQTVIEQAALDGLETVEVLVRGPHLGLAARFQETLHVLEERPVAG